MSAARKYPDPNRIPQERFAVLINLIARDQLSKAIKELLEILDTNSEYFVQILLLSRRSYALKKAEKANRLSWDEIDVRRNRIALGLYEVISELS